MIICLAIEQDNLDSLLASQFEKADYLLFYNNQTREFELIKNKKGFLGRRRTANLVAEKKPDIVITGNIEPGSFDFLQASGIKVASGIFGISVREAVERYQHGQIHETEHVPGAGRGRIL